MFEDNGKEVTAARRFCGGYSSQGAGRLVQFLNIQVPWEIACSQILFVLNSILTESGF